MDALEQSVSVIVRIVSYSPDSGSFVIKSRVIVSNGQAFSVGVMGNKGGWLGWVVTISPSNFHFPHHPLLPRHPLQYPRATPNHP